jgi:frataxin-like iron-binding protein CyaY
MTHISSDEELMYRLSKSLNDVAEGRTMDADILRKNMRLHIQKSSSLA